MDTDDRKHIRFDWTFSLGHVIQVITVACGGLGVAWSLMGNYYAIQQELAGHEGRIAFIERDRADKAGQFMAFQKEVRDSVTAIKEAVGEIKGELHKGVRP